MFDPISPTDSRLQALRKDKTSRASDDWMSQGRLLKRFASRVNLSYINREVLLKSKGRAGTYLLYEYRVIARLYVSQSNLSTSNAMGDAETAMHAVF